MGWQFWIVVALIFMVGTSLSSRHNTPERQAQRAANIDNATRQMADEICDENAWVKYPQQCEEMARKEKIKLDKRASDFR